MWVSLKHRVKVFIRHKSLLPALGETPHGGPDDSDLTFIMVARQGFDINLPNANSAIRLGFCRGFELIGIRFHLVSSIDLGGALNRFRNPIVFLSIYDYLDLTRRTIRKLRDYPHFVWGHPDPEVMVRIYQHYEDTYDYTLPQSIYAKVLDSCPKFIMAPVPPSALEYYSQWAKRGIEVKSIPLACDVTRYFPESNNNQKFEGIQVAFVGGYWKKKAIQFDKYLKPLEERLCVYGYSKWPYKGYRGLLDYDEERLLYQSAKVSPAISELHAEHMGDIVERPFKIMGSRGLAVPDVTRFYRDLFTEDELFVPKNIGEYYAFINEVLADRELNKKYRENGYRAVLQRHTYKHRAKLILAYLGLEKPEREHVAD